MTQSYNSQYRTRQISNMLLCMVLGYVSFKYWAYPFLCLAKLWHNFHQCFQYNSCGIHNPQCTLCPQVWTYLFLGQRWYPGGENKKGHVFVCSLFYPVCFYLKAGSQSLNHIFLRQQNSNSESKKLGGLIALQGTNFWAFWKQAGMELGCFKGQQFLLDHNSGSTWFSQFQ